MEEERNSVLWYNSFKIFVDEFKNESDRAAVILGAAKIDSLLSQILDRFFLPTLNGNNDELLEGDSPLSTFSSRINICYRLGIISSSFAKSLHLVRKIRNSFAHEVTGVKIDTGSHADRIKSLLLPMNSLNFYSDFRKAFFGEKSISNDFKTCLAMMTGRLESILQDITPVINLDNEFILEEWKTLDLAKNKPNNCFNLTIPVVMKIAVASLGNFHAKPFGPELQVKQMLATRLRRAKKLFPSTGFKK